MSVVTKYKDINYLKISDGVYIMKVDGYITKRIKIHDVENAYSKLMDKIDMYRRALDKSLILLEQNKAEEAKQFLKEFTNDV